MLFELKILINQFVIGVLIFQALYKFYAIFFTEISILCHKSKKWNGLKKCDWMRPCQLKEECEQ